jgi:hypothetical protein
MVVLGVFATSSSRGAELLLEYTFNDSGPQTQGTEHSAWDWPLDFQTQDGEPANWHGTAGSGVSGLAADRAFDNSAATGMGSSNQGGRAWCRLPPDVPTLDSVTLSGWFRTESVPMGGFGRLFYWDSTHQIYSFPDTVLRFSTGKKSVWSDQAYTEVGEWVFFAASFDSTQETDNVRFWKGTRTTPVTLVSTRSVAQGPFFFPSSYFTLGNNNFYSSPTQPFDGWLDNFRVHAGAGSSGVLSEGELEALRLADVAGEAPPIRLRVQLDATPVAGPPAGLQFGWWSILKHRYQLQQSADLRAWSDVPEAATDGDGERQTHLLAPVPVKPRFYRLKVVPQ